MNGKNPVNKLLDLMCMTPAGLFALVVLFVLPLIPPFNDQYLLRWLISAALTAATACGDGPSGFSLEASFTGSPIPSSRCSSSIGLPG